MNNQQVKDQQQNTKSDTFSQDISKPLENDQVREDADNYTYPGSVLQNIHSNYPNIFRRHQIHDYLRGTCLPRKRNTIKNLFLTQTHGSRNTVRSYRRNVDVFSQPLPFLAKDIEKYQRNRKLFLTCFEHPSSQAENQKAVLSNIKEHEVEEKEKDTQEDDQKSKSIFTKGEKFEDSKNGTSENCIQFFGTSEDPKKKIVHFQSPVENTDIYTARPVKFQNMSKNEMSGCDEIQNMKMLPCKDSIPVYHLKDNKCNDADVERIDKDLLYFHKEIMQRLSPHPRKLPVDGHTWKSINPTSKANVNRAISPARMTSFSLQSYNNCFTSSSNLSYLGEEPDTSLHKSAFNRQNIPPTCTSKDLPTLPKNNNITGERHLSINGHINQKEFLQRQSEGELEQHQSNLFRFNNLHNNNFSLNLAHLNHFKPTTTVKVTTTTTTVNCTQTYTIASNSQNLISPSVGSECTTVAASVANSSKDDNISWSVKHVNNQGNGIPGHHLSYSDSQEEGETNQSHSIEPVQTRHHLDYHHCTKQKFTPTLYNSSLPEAQLNNLESGDNLYQITNPPSKSDNTPLPSNLVLHLNSFVDYGKDVVSLNEAIQCDTSKIPVDDNDIDTACAHMSGEFSVSVPQSQEYAEDGNDVQIAREMSDMISQFLKDSESPTASRTVHSMSTFGKQNGPASSAPAVSEPPAYDSIKLRCKPYSYSTLSSSGQGHAMNGPLKANHGLMMSSEHDREIVEINKNATKLSNQRFTQRSSTRPGSAIPTSIDLLDDTDPRVNTPIYSDDINEPIRPRSSSRRRAYIIKRPQSAPVFGKITPRPFTPDSDISDSQPLSNKLSETADQIVNKKSLAMKPSVMKSSDTTVSIKCKTKSDTIAIDNSIYEFASVDFSTLDTDKDLLCSTPNRVQTSPDLKEEGGIDRKEHVTVKHVETIVIPSPRVKSDAAILRSFTSSIAGPYCDRVENSISIDSGNIIINSNRGVSENEGVDNRYEKDLETKDQDELNSNRTENHMKIDTEEDEFISSVVLSSTARDSPRYTNEIKVNREKLSALMTSGIDGTETYPEETHHSEIQVNLFPNHKTPVKDNEEGDTNMESLSHTPDRKSEKDIHEFDSHGFTPSHLSLESSYNQDVFSSCESGQFYSEIQTTNLSSRNVPELGSGHMEGGPQGEVFIPNLRLCSIVGADSLSNEDINNCNADNICDTSSDVEYSDVRKNVPTFTDVCEENDNRFSFKDRNDRNDTDEIGMFYVDEGVVAELYNPVILEKIVEENTPRECDLSIDTARLFYNPRVSDGEGNDFEDMLNVKGYSQNSITCEEPSPIPIDSHSFPEASMVSPSLPPVSNAPVSLTAVAMDSDSLPPSSMDTDSPAEASNDVDSFPAASSASGCLPLASNPSDDILQASQTFNSLSQAPVASAMYYNETEKHDTTEDVLPDKIDKTSFSKKEKDENVDDGIPKTDETDAVTSEMTPTVSSSFPLKSTTGHYDVSGTAENFPRELNKNGLRDPLPGLSEPLAMEVDTDDEPVVTMKKRSPFKRFFSRKKGKYNPSTDLGNVTSVLPTFEEKKDVKKTKSYSPTLKKKKTKKISLESAQSVDFTEKSKNKKEKKSKEKPAKARKIDKSNIVVLKSEKPLSESISDIPSSETSDIVNRSKQDSLPSQEDKDSNQLNETPPLTQELSTLRADMNLSIDHEYTNLAETPVETVTDLGYKGALWNNESHLSYLEGEMSDESKVTVSCENSNGASDISSPEMSIVRKDRDLYEVYVNTEVSSVVPSSTSSFDRQISSSNYSDIISSNQSESGFDVESDYDREHSNASVLNEEMSIVQSHSDLHCLNLNEQLLQTISNDLQEQTDNVATLVETQNSRQLLNAAVTDNSGCEKFLFPNNNNNTSFAYLKDDTDNIKSDLQGIADDEIEDEGNAQNDDDEGCISFTRKLSSIETTESDNDTDEALLAAACEFPLNRPKYGKGPVLDAKGIIVRRHSQKVLPDEFDSSIPCEDDIEQDIDMLKEMTGKPKLRKVRDRIESGDVSLEAESEGDVIVVGISLDSSQDDLVDVLDVADNIEGPVLADNCLPDNSDDDDGNDEGVGDTGIIQVTDVKNITTLQRTPSQLLVLAQVHQPTVEDGDCTLANDDVRQLKDSENDEGFIIMKPSQGYPAPRNHHTAGDLTNLTGVLLKDDSLDVEDLDGYHGGSNKEDLSCPTQINEAEDSQSGAMFSQQEPISDCDNEDTRCDDDMSQYNIDDDKEREVTDSMLRFVGLLNSEDSNGEHNHVVNEKDMHDTEKNVIKSDSENTNLEENTPNSPVQYSVENVVLRVAGKPKIRPRSSLKLKKGRFELSLNDTTSSTDGQGTCENVEDVLKGENENICADQRKGMGLVVSTHDTIGKYGEERSAVSDQQEITCNCIDVEDTIIPIVYERELSSYQQYKDGLSRLNGHFGNVCGEGDAGDDISVKSSDPVKGEKQDKIPNKDLITGALKDLDDFVNKDLMEADEEHEHHKDQLTSTLMEQLTQVKQSAPMEHEGDAYEGKMEVTEDVIFKSEKEIKNHSLPDLCQSFNRCEHVDDNDDKGDNDIEASVKSVEMKDKDDIVNTKQEILDRMIPQNVEGKIIEIASCGNDQKDDIKSSEVNDEDDVVDVQHAGRDGMILQNVQDKQLSENQPLVVEMEKHREDSVENEEVNTPPNCGNINEKENDDKALPIPPIPVSSKKSKLLTTENNWNVDSVLEEEYEEVVDKIEKSRKYSDLKSYEDIPDDDVDDSDDKGKEKKTESPSSKRFVFPWKKKDRECMDKKTIADSGNNEKSKPKDREKKVSVKSVGKSSKSKPDAKSNPDVKLKVKLKTVNKEDKNGKKTKGKGWQEDDMYHEIEMNQTEKLRNKVASQDDNGSSESDYEPVNYIEDEDVKKEVLQKQGKVLKEKLLNKRLADASGYEVPAYHQTVSDGEKSKKKREKKKKKKDKSCAKSLSNENNTPPPPPHSKDDNDIVEELRDNKELIMASDNINEDKHDDDDDDIITPYLTFQYPRTIDNGDIYVDSPLVSSPDFEVFQQEKKSRPTSRSDSASTTTEEKFKPMNLTALPELELSNNRQASPKAKASGIRKEFSSPSYSPSLMRKDEVSLMEAFAQAFPSMTGDIKPQQQETGSPLENKKQLDECGIDSDIGSKSDVGEESGSTSESLVIQASDILPDQDKWRLGLSHGVGSLSRELSVCSLTCQNTDVKKSSRGDNISDEKVEMDIHQLDKGETLSEGSKMSAKQIDIVKINSGNDSESRDTDDSEPKTKSKKKKEKKEKKSKGGFFFKRFEKRKEGTKTPSQEKPNETSVNVTETNIVVTDSQESSPLSTPRIDNLSLQSSKEKEKQNDKMNEIECLPTFKTNEPEEDSPTYENSEENCQVFLRNHPSDSQGDHLLPAPLYARVKKASLTKSLSLEMVNDERFENRLEKTVSLFDADFIPNDSCDGMESAATRNIEISKDSQLFFSDSQPKENKAPNLKSIFISSDDINDYDEEVEYDTVYPLNRFTYSSSEDIEHRNEISDKSSDARNNDAQDDSTKNRSSDAADCVSFMAPEKSQSFISEDQWKDYSPLEIGQMTMALSDVGKGAKPKPASRMLSLPPAIPIPKSRTLPARANSEVIEFDRNTLAHFDDIWASEQTSPRQNYAVESRLSLPPEDSDSLIKPKLRKHSPGSDILDMTTHINIPKKQMPPKPERKNAYIINDKQDNDAEDDEDSEERNTDDNKEFDSCSLEDRQSMSDEYDHLPVRMRQTKQQMPSFPPFQPVVPSTYMSRQSAPIEYTGVQKPLRVARESSTVYAAPWKEEDIEQLTPKLPPRQYRRSESGESGTTLQGESEDKRSSRLSLTSVDLGSESTAGPICPGTLRKSVSLGYGLDDNRKSVDKKKGKGSKNKGENNGKEDKIKKAISFRTLTSLFRRKKSKKGNKDDDTEPGDGGDDNWQLQRLTEDTNKKKDQSKSKTTAKDTSKPRKSSSKSDKSKSKGDRSSSAKPVPTIEIVPNDSTSARPVCRLVKINEDETREVELIRHNNGRLGVLFAKGVEAGSEDGLFINSFHDKSTAKLFAGILCIGDEVLNIDGEDVHYLTLEEVKDIIGLKDKMTLRIVPSGVARSSL